VRVTALAALVGLALGPDSLASQTANTAERTLTVGTEFKRVELGGGSTKIRQLAVPFAIVIPAGRFSLDLGGYYASTRLELGTAERTLSHLTDTQVRGSYTFGRDQVVASVVFNLPTGLSRAPPADFPVQGAISSSFLSFPVNSYGNGFSATGGLAAAVPAGDWNLGLAVGLRLSGRYTPYVDATGPLSYKPGLEGRIRAGVDRIVGQSRVTAGLTWSTFGTDQLSSGSIVAGRYQPGPRWIAEALAAVPVGRSRLSVEAWHYQRSQGDSLGQVVANDERLSSLGVAITTGLTGSATFRIGVDGRLWKRGDSDGSFAAATASLGFRLGQRITITPEGRYETGRLEPSTGRVTVRGLYGALLLRSTL
jgi:hypothetical protein